MSEQLRKPAATVQQEAATPASPAAVLEQIVDMTVQEVGNDGIL